MVKTNNDPLLDNETSVNQLKDGSIPSTTDLTNKRETVLPLIVRIGVPLTLATSVLTLLVVVVMISQVSGLLGARITVPAPGSSGGPLPPPDTPHWGYPYPPVHDSDDTVWFAHRWNHSSEYLPYTKHDGSLTEWEDLSSPHASATPPPMFYDWYPPDPPSDWGSIYQYPVQHNSDTSVYYAHDGTDSSSWVPYGKHYVDTTGWIELVGSSDAPSPMVYDQYPSDPSSPSEEPAVDDYDVNDTVGYPLVTP